jgi:uncharacterized membrane protein YjdF
MENKNKISFNDFFEFAMYALAIICFVYFLIKGVPAKLLEPVLIVVVLIAIRWLVKFTQIELFSALRLSILIFIFITMFLANEFAFYSVIPFLDKAEHLLSGVVLFFVGQLVCTHTTRKYDQLRLPFTTTIFFCLFFSVAMAACWEIYEFTTDRLFGLNSQNGSLVDTMGDIICGTIGAALTSIYYAIFKRRKNEHEN